MLLFLSLPEVHHAKCMLPYMIHLTCLAVIPGCLKWKILFEFDQNNGQIANIKVQFQLLSEQPQGWTMLHQSIHEKGEFQ